MTQNNESSGRGSNPILSLLPEALIPYALLARIDKPVGIGLLFLPALFGILIAKHNNPSQTLSHTLYSTFLLLTACILARSIGCCWNDLQDRHLDKHVERTKTRPLASGQLSPKNAILFITALLALSLPLILILPHPVFIILIPIAALVSLYPFTKRFTFWPQIFLGITFNSTLIIGWLVASNATLQELFSAPEPWIAYLATILWTLGYDTIYAYQDIKDDTTHNIKSTARLFPNSPLPVYTAFLLAAITLSFSHALIIPHFLFSLSLIPAFLYAFYTLKLWNLKSPSSSLKTFKNQIYVGTLVAIGLLPPL
jgi:4-hydroxybenzoate polyprenyltransferase